MSMLRCEHLLDIVIIKSICYACEYSTQYPKSCNENCVNASWEIEPEYSSVGGLEGKSDNKLRVNPLVEGIKTSTCVAR